MARKTELDKAIDLAIKATARGTVLAHKAGVMCLAHAEQHGDFMPLARLVFGCPAFMQSKLRDWARAFSPVTFETANKIAKKDNSESAKPFNVVGASEVNPFEMKREKKDATFDSESFADSFDKLLKRFEKNSDDADVKRIIRTLRALEARNFGTIGAEGNAVAKPALQEAA
jgi:hypothetical protein